MNILIQKFNTVNVFNESLFFGMLTLKNVQVKFEAVKLIDFNWTNVIIFEWPHTSITEDFLKKLKLNKILLVLYVHNILPHDLKGIDLIEAYKRLYSYADILVHLGEYSLSIMKKQYPNAVHIIIPHHTYENIIPVYSEKKEDMKSKLGLNNNIKYIYSKGALRYLSEKDAISKIKDFCLQNNYRIIVPEIKDKHIYTVSKNLDYSKLCELMLSSDLVWINRPQNLNSGNVSFGMLYGKPLVIPKVGNMWQEALPLGNGIYKNVEEIPTLISNASKDIGLRNLEYAKNFLKPEIIADRLLNEIIKVIESQ